MNWRLRKEKEYMIELALVLMVLLLIVTRLTEK